MGDTERHQFRLAPTKRLQWRLGVAGANCARSGTFKVWASHAANQSKADIYIAGRSMGGAMEVSIHASGLRQVGLTSDFTKRTPLPDGKSRHYDTWTEPIRISDALALEYVLRFPTAHLRHMPEPREANKVMWIPAAPPGRCLDVALCVSEPMDHLRLDFNGMLPVAFGKLVDGRFMLLAIRHGDVDRHDNEAALLAEMDRLHAEKDLGADPSDRLLVGFNAAGLRGWVDYSVQRFVQDAREHGKREAPDA